MKDMKNNTTETTEYNSFRFATGKTLPLTDEDIDRIRTCERLLLLGNIDGLFTDCPDGETPSLMNTTLSATGTFGISTKAILTCAFLERFQNPKRYTQFIIHESQKNYYIKMFEDLAKNSGPLITFRERNETTYKAAFMPNINISIEEYNADMEKLSKIEMHTIEQRDEIHRLMNKYTIINLIYNDGKIVDAFPQNVMISTFKNAKDLGKCITKTKTDKKTGRQTTTETTVFSMAADAFRVRVGGSKNLKYDRVIMNPPYNIGSKIVHALISYMDLNTDAIVLGPMSMYKTNENYKHIVSHEVVENLFEDANITKNLSVVKISKMERDVDWQSIEIETFDQKFRPFYEVNSKMPLICNMTQSNYLKREDIDLDVDIIESNRLPSIPNINTMGGFNGFRKGDNLGYKANVLYQLDEVLSATCYMKTSSKKCKENFCKWAYTDNPKNLANMLLCGLHMATGSSVCNVAIPQIDWENISNHPLWKQGDYDGAVLDVMSLKWNDNHDGVVLK